MANINKLVKAFEAFTNKDETTATKLFRSFFVESAQEINKNLEESDDFGEPDQGDDLVDDVAYDLDEGEEDPLAQDEPVDGGDEFGGEPDADAPVDEPAGDEFGELGDDVGADAPVTAEPPTADEWAEIEAAYAELASLFDELGVSADEPVDEPVGDEGQGGLDFDEPADETDLNKPLGEDYDYPVPAVDTADAATNKTSPVAGNADAPVDGVEPVRIVSSTKEPEHPAVKVDDQNTVEKSGKGIYGTASEKGATKDTVHSDSLLRPRK